MTHESKLVKARWSYSHYDLYRRGIKPGVELEKEMGASKIRKDGKESLHE